MLIRRAPPLRAEVPPPDEWVAGCHAASASIGTKISLPIAYRGRVIGVACDGRWRPSTPDERRCGFAGLADMKSEWAAGKHWRVNFDYGWQNGHPSGTPAWNDSFVCAQTLDPPPYGFTGSTLTFRQFDDSNSSALQHGGNKSPDTKHLLRLERSAGGAASSAVAIIGMLVDRVGAYEACTIASTLQTMTNTLTPQRYASAGQEGLQVYAGCQTTTGATAANFTGHYTDSSGGTGQSFPTTAMTLAAQTSTQVPAVGEVLFPSGDPGGNGENSMLTPFLPLPSVNSGVRKVEDYIFSAANTGTFYLALMHPIAYLGWDKTAYQEFDLLNYHFNLGRIFDGACLHMLIKDSNAPNSSPGAMEVLWG